MHNKIRKVKQPAFTCRECLLQDPFSCLYNQPAVFKERYKLSRTCGFSVRTGPSEQGFSPGKSKSVSPDKRLVNQCKPLHPIPDTVLKLPV